MSEPLLQVKGLKKYFPVTQGLMGKVIGHVKAVDDVSFTINQGETLGLVGESGCGKTTVGRTLLRLIEPTEGSIVYCGQDLTMLGHAQLRSVRKQMQIIFQDPFSSLNPRMTAGAIVAEGLVVQGMGDRQTRARMVAETLEKVGLSASCAGRYPHEFSGGQRQRIGIARALILEPRLIICDEPVSALDVSIQAQIINLLIEIQKSYGMSFLFIAHDLSVVKYISDRVAVMYLGKIVESAPSEALYAQPLHPYTRALLEAAPVPDPEHRKTRTVLEGDVPSPLNPPAGCTFHPRCPLAEDICKTQPPRIFDAGDGHIATCHMAEKALQESS